MTEQRTQRLNYISLIQRSIDYIEENLRSDITLQACAGAAGFSTYHYYRVFAAYVGLPVMEYVRKRKLAHAINDLKTGQRVIDIALDYGFGSERAFSRAFKNENGISPGRYRKLVHTSTVPVKLVLKTFQQNNINGGVVMEPKIVQKPPTKVAGFECKTTSRNGLNYKVLPEFWTRYIKENWRQKLLDNIRPTGMAELGICFPGDISEEDFSYVIGMEVDDFKGIPEEFFKGEIPAATFAVFTTPPADRHKDFVKVIQGTWDYIYHTWFPESGYEFDGNVKIDYELYDERSDGDFGIQMDIYVPVVKKT